MINMKDTEEKFNEHPSMWKAQEIERNVEGVSIDYGYYHSSGVEHEILKEEDTNTEPY